MGDERLGNQLNLVRSYLSSDEYYQQVETSLWDPKATNDKGYTLLHAAASSHSKNIRIVQLLLHRGADVNAATPFGYTPLHFAVASRGRLNVNILIRNGASLTAQDFKGRTALHFAIGEFWYKSPNPAFNYPCDMKIVKRLLREAELCIDARDESGETPLMWAVNERNFNAVRFLLKRGANPDIPNQWNQPPLHRALYVSGQKDHIIAFELLQAGAGIYCVDNMDQTAVDILLHVSARDDRTLQFARECLRLIALRRQRSEYLERRLAKVWMLSQTFEKCCKEVHLMKGVILRNKFTLHDYVLNCFQREGGWEINSKVVEILLSGLITEYFDTILGRLSKGDLRDVLARFMSYDLSYRFFPLSLGNLSVLNTIRYFYDANVFLRRQLLNRTENLFTIYNEY